MKANEITVGKNYYAKVSGKITMVRVDAIHETLSAANVYPFSDRPAKRYEVTNLSTGRRTTFRSAARFRRGVVSLTSQGLC
jgi:hypothetical protein